MLLLLSVVFFLIGCCFGWFVVVGVGLLLLALLVIVVQLLLAVDVVEILWCCCKCFNFTVFITCMFSLLLLFLDSLFGCLWQCKVNLFLRYIYRFEGGKVV